MKDYFSLAFNNLKRRKLRSWLTMMGIFIGIAAVVALISLGQGLQNHITEEFEKLGRDKIMIQPKTLGPPGSATSKSIMLTANDLEVVKNSKGVEWVIGVIYKVGQIEFKKELEITYLIGINPKEIKLMSDIQSFQILKGRWLKEGDKFKVIVGYNHAYGKIWDRKVRIGDTMQIEGHDFKVVGIVEKVGNPIDDAQVYVPKNVLKELLDTGDEESWIMAKTASGFNPENVAETIEKKLRKSRGEREGQETFVVQTSEQLLESFGNILGVVQAVLVGIAAISLIVGGIGIMNTMYTSVLERTKQIGVMKAIGASNDAILSLFLIESGMIGLVGGVFGIFLGILAAYFIGLAAAGFGVRGLFSFASLDFLGFFVILIITFITGVISGILPARQAANMEPAEALRYVSCLSPSALVILNTEAVIPFMVTLGRSGYPSLPEITEKLAGASGQLVTLDAPALAREAGSHLAANIVMLGAMFASGRLPLRVETAKREIEAHFPARLASVNIRAFDLGYQTSAGRSADRQNEASRSA